VCGSNTVSGNTIANNMGYGIIIEAGSNLVYHNNFINSGEAHAMEISNNLWYNATLQEGNYWDDYTERYPPIDEEPPFGIWDTPYEILYMGEFDLYPLVSEYTLTP
jgi:parallel beta-helix repeat protein